MKTLQGFYKYKSPTNIHIINSNYYNSYSNYKSDNKYNNLYTINYNNIRNNEIKTENNNTDKNFLKSQNFFAKDYKHFNIPKNNNQESNQNKIKNQNKLNYNFYLSSHKFYSNGNNTEKNLKNNAATLPAIKTSYTPKISQNHSTRINFYDDIIKNYKNNTINKNFQITNVSNTNNLHPNKSNSQTRNNYRYFQSQENNNIINNNSNNHSPSTRLNFFKSSNFLSKLDEPIKSLSYFSRLAYPLYKNAKQSEKSFDIITSYAANTYKGTVRNYNEDRISVIVNVKNNNYQNLKEKSKNKLSFFAIYDGHAGNKCCEYLKNNLHIYIFESNFFPEEPIKAIQQAFDKCEKKFLEANQSRNKNQKNKIITNFDHSGSCAIIILIINDICYTINLGDSRALYSYNSGNKFYQLSRDHKPNDPLEKSRIYKAGGSIYKTNLASYGFSFGVNENSLGFQIPYRILPGRLAVSKFLLFYFYMYLGRKSLWRYKF